MPEEIIKVIHEIDRTTVQQFANAADKLSRGLSGKSDEELKKTIADLKKQLKLENNITKEKMSFQNLLSLFRSVCENAWVEYLIYRDLRDRGYVVREGFGLGINFRVYERGGYGKDTAKYLIFGIQEGQPTSMEVLSRALRHSQSLKKTLVLAVLNRRGEVVYYSLSKLTIT